MYLYDLLILLNKCSARNVNVFILCENAKVSYTYCGSASELLEKIKQSLLYHCIVAYYKYGQSIIIKCVL